MKDKKISSIKKTLLIMFAVALFGGILGMIFSIILNVTMPGLEQGAALFFITLQNIMLPAMILITFITVIYGEINLHKQRKIGEQILESEDEECDRWEYEEEKNTAAGMIINILSQVLCVLLLSVGYSMKYIPQNDNNTMIFTCIVFLFCFCYDAIWRTRHIRNIQRIHPEKTADSSSRHFQKEWLESCDEAEKEIIYQSAYHSYIRTNACIPALLVVTMLGHLFFDTGIMAILIVGIMWLVITTSYIHSCVKLKKNKIN